MIVENQNKTIATNFFEVSLNKPLVQYSIVFSPQIEVQDLDQDSLRQINTTLKKTIFDKDFQFKIDHPNSTLFLNFSIYTIITTGSDEYKIENFEWLNKQYSATLIKNQQNENKTFPDVLGYLFKALPNCTKLQRIGRKQFDSSKVRNFYGGKLGIVQGYETSIIKTNKIFLQVNPCIKSVREPNFLQQIQEYGQNAPEKVKGNIVMANYGKVKRFFRIEELMIDMTPQDSFTKKDGTKESYIDYYKKIHGVNITKSQQPLLKIIQKRRGKEETIFVIPELCCATGETDQMRADFNLQKELSCVKQARAPEKMNQTQDYINKLLQDAKQKIDEWQIKINQVPFQTKLENIVPGQIIMKNKQINIPSNLDRETQDVMLRESFEGQGIQRVQIIYSQRSQQICNTFMQYLQQSIQSLKFSMQAPQTNAVNGQDAQSWINQINDQAQLIIFILPGAKKQGRNYDEIKRYLIKNKGISSQVILESTAKKEKGLRVVCNKLLVQISAKTQGVPYTIKPLPQQFSQNPTMVVGIDIFHKTQGGKKASILGFVATVDQDMGRYFSDSQQMLSEQDISSCLQETFKKAINSFGQKNKCAPKSIIVYRDGVSKGQFQAIKDTEVQSALQAIQSFGNNTKNTKLIYINVNKRVPAQFYLANKNQVQPSQCTTVESGTLISQDLTDGDNDFYLVSQACRQGVASPTHYHILHNDYEQDKDINQQIKNDVKVLSYKLCFLYFNMTGAIKIPAPVKYAHVLSNFVGDRFDFSKPNTLITAHSNFQKQNVLYFI